MTLKQFEKTAGLRFLDKNLLVQALTHRSYINENPRHVTDHNERLEFLGDAVLELVATEYLYERFPQKSEGELTAIRAAIVNTNSLSDCASGLGLNELLLLSRGEARDRGRARMVILANTFEALVGAIYLDQGYKPSREFLERHLLPSLDAIINEKLWQDAKSLFQEKAQEEWGVTPVYQTLSEVGPDHAKRFTVGLYAADKLISRGEGHSKQEAEVSAARAGLKKKGWG